MWNCTVLENDLNHSIDRLVFDFGHNITLVADYDTKIIKKYYGKIVVNEYTDCFTIDEINSLVKNISEEILNRM